MEISFIFQILVNGLSLGMYYILVASGFTLVFGVSRIFNFAHGELYMLGAYCAFYFFGQWGINYYVVIILAMILIGILGLIIERVFFRPLYEKIMYASFMVALALQMIIPCATMILLGERTKDVPNAFPGSVRLLGSYLSWERIAVIIGSTIIMILMWLFIQRTTTGRAMRAVAQDPESASLQGIDIYRMRVIAFTAGAMLAGAAGVLVAPLFSAEPGMGGLAIFKAVVVVVLGGIGSIPGAVVGGLLLGFVDSFGLTFIGYPAHIAGWVIVIIILLVRPMGILGKELI